MSPEARAVFETICGRQPPSRLDPWMQRALTRSLTGLLERDLAAGQKNLAAWRRNRRLHRSV